MRPFSASIPRYTRFGRLYVPEAYDSHALHPRVKKLARRLEARAKMEDPDYKTWSQESLVERVTQLERELKIKNLKSVYSLLPNVAGGY